MAHIDVTEITLHQGMGRTIEVRVLDDSGTGVNLNATGTEFGIAFTPQNVSRSPTVVNKNLGSADVSVDSSDTSQANIEITAGDFGDDKLHPDLYGWWFSAVYKAPDEEPALVGEGPVSIEAVATVTLS